MFNILHKNNGSQSEDIFFPSWTPLENIPAVSNLPDVFRQPCLDFHSETNHFGQKAGAISTSIVFGLGQAGQIILGSWMKRIQESGSSAQNVRSYWLYHSEQNQPSFPEIIGRHRQINIQSDGGSEVNSASSSREAMHICMNQADVYGRLKANLIGDAQHLDGRIRIFVVASACEPIVGIVGDLLQLLSILKSGKIFKNNITVSCILALDGTADAGELSDAETFAVVREISRLTFKGLHVMPPTITERIGLLQNEALEYLFVVETPGLFDQMDSSKQLLTFETGSAEVCAETLYTLTHPTGDIIWGDLINCLTTGTTTIQKALQTPLVYGVTAASLYLPVALLQQYAVLRMTHAALFGEKASSGEGLLKGASEEQDIQNLAQGWLTAKPHPHPFFTWLLKARQSPRPLPPLFSAEACARVFKQRLCNQLNLYLNSPAGSLKCASQVIDWLLKLHSEISNQLKASPSLKNDKTARSEQAVIDYLAAAKDILESTSKELTAWNNIFDQRSPRENLQKDVLTSGQSPLASNPFGDASVARSSKNNPFEISASQYGLQLENPFGLPSENNSGDVRQTHAKANEILFRLPDLGQQIQVAYQSLVNAGNAPICRSVIQKTSGADEIENIYWEIIRPEVTNGAVPSPYFERIRDRLGWWADIDNITGHLRLKIVALPHTWNPTSDRPASAAFSTQQAGEFYARLIDICAQEMRSLKNKFSDQRFVQSALNKKGFLGRASQTCIHYDSKGVAGDRQIAPETAKPFGYLLYKPVETQQALNFRETAFDNLVSAHSRDIEWSEMRVSALQILTNLPAWRIDALSRSLPLYHGPKTRHLYNPERNALEYERRVLDERNENVFFSPRTCMLLADIELVRLFFRAYLAGMIRLTSNGKGWQARDMWAVVDVPMPGLPQGSVYPPLFLESTDTSAASLWEALESFALSLPNRQLNDIPPSDPFHREERERYLSSLLTRARDLMKAPESQSLRKQISSKVLAELDEAAKSNNLASDLACIFRLELFSLT